mmetsp:Transcript_143329/g.445545  ORF Transcript_143329/g.445545 Transcript_143329/m.445545 type:complete len:233 (+) Transcript_143329:717-1415(+)
MMAVVREDPDEVPAVARPAEGDAGAVAHRHGLADHQGVGAGGILGQVDLEELDVCGVHVAEGPGDGPGDASSGHVGVRELDAAIGRCGVDDHGRLAARGVPVVEGQDRRRVQRPRQGGFSSLLADHHQVVGPRRLSAAAAADDLLPDSVAPRVPDGQPVGAHRHRRRLEVAVPQGGVDAVIAQAWTERMVHQVCRVLAAGAGVGPGLRRVPDDVPVYPQRPRRRVCKPDIRD